MTGTKGDFNVGGMVRKKSRTEDEKVTKLKLLEKLVAVASGPKDLSSNYKRALAVNRGK